MISIICLLHSETKTAALAFDFAKDLGNVARGVFLVFVKPFVVELNCQHHGGEHTITEAEAQALLRSQIDELSGGAPLTENSAWSGTILSEAIKLHFIWWQVASGMWQVALASITCNLQLATCNQKAKCQIMPFASI